MGAISKRRQCLMISFNVMVLIGVCFLLIISVSEVSLSPSTESLSVFGEVRSASQKVKSLSHAYRIPKIIVPEKYYLTITPIVKSGFESSLGPQWFAPGEVLIKVRATEATKNIVLHSKNITIHNVTVIHKTTEIPVQNVSYDEKYSFLKISLKDQIIPGDPYAIRITFTSYISEVLNGLFRSKYKDEDTGEEEWFAATHMEALHARQMMPCFDTPGMKAVIQAKVGRPAEYVALFNTESIGNETMQGVEGWVWETFAPTVPMSTYLIAIVIAKFKFSEASGRLLPDVRVRTYAPAQYVNQGAAQYSANAAEKILHTYGKYFNESYPMKKFDSVAVPSFLYGAMENFGLSIFRETLLLHFENESTETQRYIVTNVICHELGHQWFGNLVSPEWWTHLWLSEGLTKFTEYIGLNATVPEFRPWDIFISESMQLGLRLDGDQRTSHSLKIDEDSWAMRNEMEWFDDIAYKKGGSLIRMMQGFLTEPILKKGLSRYLSRLKYQSAIQNDLFSDCDKEGKLAHKLPENTTLMDIMSGWTLQAGFPLLNVTHKPGTNQIRVTQQQYIASKTNRDNFSGRKLMWFIPVSVATSRHPNFDPEPEFWIKNNESSVAITLPTDSWIILNAGTTGFYRVIYDAELTRRITDQLMEFPFKIDKLARSQLIDDYFNAAWNRYIPIDRALNLTLYMKAHAETEHVVWTSVLSMLKVSFRLFKESKEDFELFRSYMLPRLENAIQATGGYSAININSTGLPVVRHAQLLDWSCSLQSNDCIDYAIKSISSWKSTGILEVPRDFRSVIFPTAVSNDPSGDLFEFLLKKYKELQLDNMSSSKLKEQLLAALASTQDQNKINLLLNKIFEENELNDTSQATSLLEHMAMNPFASEIILQYFIDKSAKIIERFGDVSPITAAGNSMAPHLKSLNGLFLIEQLIQTNEESLKSSFAPVLNRIRANIIWYDDFGENMLEFFEQNK